MPSVTHYLFFHCLSFFNNLLFHTVHTFLYLFQFIWAVMLKVPKLVYLFPVLSYTNIFLSDFWKLIQIYFAPPKYPTLYSMNKMYLSLLQLTQLTLWLFFFFLWFVYFLLPDLCLSLSGYSELDRDFWNNNDSSNVQQRWSSYPPKEFLLNMSPYAPYGDPRLTPKWVPVSAWGLCSS